MHTCTKGHFPLLYHCMLTTYICARQRARQHFCLTRLTLKLCYPQKSSYTSYTHFSLVLHNYIILTHNILTPDFPLCAREQDVFHFFHMIYMTNYDNNMTNYGNNITYTTFAASTNESRITYIQFKSANRLADLKRPYLLTLPTVWQSHKNPISMFLAFLFCNHIGMPFVRKGVSVCGGTDDGGTEEV